MVLPSSKAPIPAIKLTAMFTHPSMLLSLFISCRVSLLNVENVVNAPRKPTKMSEFREWFGWFDVFRKPESIPKRKQPRIFTIKVPQGKLDPRVRFWTVPPKRYLRTAPTNPPIPMMRMLFKELHHAFHIMIVWQTAKPGNSNTLHSLNLL